MEGKTLCEDSIGLCFEAGEVQAAVAGIGEPITAYYAFKQVLVEADQLLLVCLRCPSFGINFLIALVHGFSSRSWNELILSNRLTACAGLPGRMLSSTCMPLAAAASHSARVSLMNNIWWLAISSDSAIFL